MQTEAETPQKQANLIPGRGGVIPPVHSRWQPGESGNPGGQQKGVIYVTEAYKRLGAMDIEKLRAAKFSKAIECAVQKAILRAVDADDWQAAHAALKELTDRLEGKAVQKKVVERVDVQCLEISIVVQLRALAKVEGRELSHEDALLELAQTREKLERAQEMGLLEAIEAEYQDA